MSDLVEIYGVTKSYTSQQAALSNVSSKLLAGKIIGLLGPNGSGKTTLIKLMNGLLSPDAGVIKIHSVEVGPETKSMVAYLPDKTYLAGNQKIRKILDYFADFYPDFNREKALEMLTKLGIDVNSRMDTLSKGNKEKVQLILVMSRKAKLYLLDEPIAGVDPAARDYILQTILTSYNPEASVIISTHLISDVEQVLDEVIFMNKGHLVLYTSAENIRNEHGKSIDAYFREVFRC